MKRAIIILLAAFTGASTAVAAKRVELDQRLDAIAGADPASRSVTMRLAQWLNGNQFNNFNNWPNY